MNVNIINTRPMPASSPLYPAIILKALLAPRIPIGTRIKGYNKPRFIAPMKGMDIVDTPALITTIGRANGPMNITLCQTLNPFFQPNRSSRKPRKLAINSSNARLISSGKK